MSIILETEHFTLRPFEVSDAHEVRLMQTDRLYEFLPKPEKAKSDDEVVDRIHAWRECMEASPGLGLWRCAVRGTDEFCGSAYLSRLNENLHHFGGMLLPSAWGRNCAYECGGVVLDHAFETVKLNSVVGLMHQGNRSTQTLAMAWGLTHFRDFELSFMPVSLYYMALPGWYERKRRLAEYPELRTFKGWLKLQRQGRFNAPSSSQTAAPLSRTAVLNTSGLPTQDAVDLARTMASSEPTIVDSRV